MSGQMHCRGHILDLQALKGFNVSRMEQTGAIARNSSPLDLRHATCYPRDGTVNSSRLSNSLWLRIRLEGLTQVVLHPTLPLCMQRSPEQPMLSTPPCSDYDRTTAATGCMKYNHGSLLIS